MAESLHFDILISFEYDFVLKSNLCVKLYQFIVWNICWFILINIFFSIIGIVILLV